MKVKAYYARSVEEAVDSASSEMGTDAMLVHSRKTPVEMRHLGPYEVTFALPQKAAKKAREEREAAAPATEEPSTAALSVEMLQLRRQMEDIRRSLAARPEPVSECSNAGTLAAQAYQFLLSADIDAELATAVSEIAAAELKRDGVADQAQPELSSEMKQALKAELGRRMVPCAGVRPRGETATIVALVGPPGVGKTSALVKLAVTLGQSAAKPVHLIGSDTWRVGAGEQLRTYASILGLSVDTADTPAALSQAIEANRHKELILIDTPGLSGADFDLLEDVAGFLGRRTEIEKHLVLPATMRSRDLKRTLRQFERFQPSRLLFTRLDETDAFGAMCSTAIASALPMSYFSAGQQIPEDLEAAATGKLLDVMLGIGGAPAE